MKKTLLLLLGLATLIVADADFDNFRRFCAYMHNEGCSQLNAEPGPCTRRIDCLKHVCTSGMSGNCIDDSSLEWCESLDCSEISTAARISEISVRQKSNPLGSLGKMFA